MFAFSSLIYCLPWPQQEPVNPGGHWQEYEQVFVLAMQLPLFKQGLELHGLVSINKKVGIKFQHVQFWNIIGYLIKTLLLKWN